MTRICLYLLGAPRIEVDARPAMVDTRKAVALLAYLAVSEAVQARDSLAALLWPGYDQHGARAALRRTLSVLNKALGQKGLLITREAVAIAPSGVFWSDAGRFRQCLSLSRQHAHPPGEACPECLPFLEEAASLYRGDFMAGFSLRDSLSFDDWQFFQAEAFRQELGSALERLSRSYAERKGYETALAYARRWLALDPLREEAHRQLMLLYAWSGERNAALRQYRECVRILEQELGVPPLEETTSLYQNILENRLPTQPEPRASGSPLAPALEVSPLKSGLQPGAYPLVGRQVEWQQLLRAYSQSASEGCFFILEGEAGIGKSRLAEEFTHFATMQGAPVLAARCYAGETNLAYGPFITGLRAHLSQPGADLRLQALPPHVLVELTRLLPELPSRQPDPARLEAQEGPGASSRFLDGLRQALVGLLAGAPPGVLFMDDLQWADSASLELLAFLVRRLPGTPLFILATWRNDSLAATPGLSALLGEAQRLGVAVRLGLSRLAAADVDELLASLSPQSEAVPAGFSQRLYQETEGLPFFLVEYLASLFQDGSISPGAEWNLPPSVRDVLNTRLADLSETAGQLLSTAAVIGRSFDFATLQAASGRSELEAVAGLETLLASGLILERRGQSAPGESDYDFTHEKLRSLVYEDTSLARRRLLHRRVAETLAGPAPGRADSGSLAAQIAGHYHLAGQDALAAGYFKASGDAARLLFANNEALSHYRAALAAGYPDAAELHTALGDLYVLRGEYEAAISAYETAASISAPSGLPDLEHRLGEVHARRGEWELAECHFEAALEEYGSQASPAALAPLFCDWSWEAHLRGEAERALGLATRALAAAESSADQAALAQAYNLLGILHRQRGDLEQAAQYLQSSLQIAESRADPALRAAALNNLAQVSAQRGDLDGAIRLTATALELCSRQGDRHHEAALHNNLADLYHAAGMPEEAMAHLKQAVVIFYEIGAAGSAAPAGEPLPEIWKLTEW